MSAPRVLQKADAKEMGISENAHNHWNNMNAKRYSRDQKLRARIAKLEAALADNEQIKKLVCKLQMAAGCSCCRDDDAWYAAKNALAEMFGLSKYADNSGYDWEPLESAVKAAGGVK